MLFYGREIQVFLIRIEDQNFFHRISTLWQLSSIPALSVKIEKFLDLIYNNNYIFYIRRKNDYIIEIIHNTYCNIT